MLHPYQCITAVGEDHLVAACGPRLLSLNLESGSIVSEWMPNEAASATSNSQQEGDDDGERPAKKQKSIKAPEKPANIILLAVSESKNHVVAVTDDKSVRVFEHIEGKLRESSQRYMPKRPCAVQILPDNATILIGDKFGDVYALPLIPAATEVEDISAEAEEDSPQPDRRFKPSASNLTVHSKRNLKALEAQMNQKNFTPRKEPLKFEHKLLLGHVSMLTDLKYLIDRSHVKERGYIVTTDRDEHIRLSRGPPQAHVIEGYCLGHSEFVSKICQVGQTNLLVSGGGDDWLGIWKWPESKLLGKIDLMRYVRELSSPKPKDYKLAVSGIWTMSISASNDSPMGQIIIVACERVAALFMVSLLSLEAALTKSEHENYKPIVSVAPLENHPVDVATVGGRIVVSLDARENQQQRLQSLWPKKEDSAENCTTGVCFELDSEANGYSMQLKSLNEDSGSEQDVTDKDMDELLYGVSNLRKRRDQESQEGEQEDGGDGGQNGHDAANDE